MDMILTIERSMRNTELRMLIREFRAMGCQMLALLQTDAPLVADPLAQVPEWFEGWEQQLSRFRADSELSLLNNSPARREEVSPELWEVLQIALAMAEATEGLVTPAVLNALEAAGYDRSFEALGMPGPGDDAAAPSGAS